MILRIKSSFLLLLLLGTNINAQNTKILKKHQQMQFVDAAYHYDFAVLAVYKKEPAFKNSYTWYMNNTIHTTQGNYSGKLLDGIYSKYDNKTNQLVVKGNYEKGLKKAEWYEWQTNGNLLSYVEYKNGMKHGNAIFYDSSGNIIEQCSFKKDKKHGKSISFVDGVKQLPVLYKHGEIQQKKERVSKESKEKQQVKERKKMMKTDFLRSKNKKK